jgi:hypothetical protein
VQGRAGQGDYYTLVSAGAWQVSELLFCKSSVHCRQDLHHPGGTAMLVCLVTSALWLPCAYSAPAVSSAETPIKTAVTPAMT